MKRFIKTRCSRKGVKSPAFAISFLLLLFLSAAPFAGCSGGGHDEFLDGSANHPAEMKTRLFERAVKADRLQHTTLDNMTLGKKVLPSPCCTWGRDGRWSAPLVAGTKRLSIRSQQWSASFGCCSISEHPAVAVCAASIASAPNRMVSKWKRMYWRGIASMSQLGSMLSLSRTAALHSSAGDPVRALDTFSTLPLADADEIFQVLETVYGEDWSSSSRLCEHGLTDSEKDEWQQKGLPLDEAIYGEITASGIRELLKRADARPGERFYDLGSGDGKAVMLAWLSGLESTGIELVRNRFEASCGALGKVKECAGLAPASSKILFLLGSFLDLSFADADIIFMNNVCWGKETLEKLAVAAEALGKGTRIISAKPLPGNDFETRGSWEVPVSWISKKWGVPVTIGYEYTMQVKVTDAIAPEAQQISPNKVLATQVCER